MLVCVVCQEVCVHEDCLTVTDGHRGLQSRCNFSLIARTDVHRTRWPRWSSAFGSARTSNRLLRNSTGWCCERHAVSTSCLLPLSDGWLFELPWCACVLWNHAARDGWSCRHAPTACAWGACIPVHVSGLRFAFSDSEFILPLFVRFQRACVAPAEERDLRLQAGPACTNTVDLSSFIVMSAPRSTLARALSDLCDPIDPSDINEHTTLVNPRTIDDRSRVSLSSSKIVLQSMRSHGSLNGRAMIDQSAQSIPEDKSTTCTV
jgi:hypothetical protein